MSNLVTVHAWEGKVVGGTHRKYYRTWAAGTYQLNEYGRIGGTPTYRVVKVHPNIVAAQNAARAHFDKKAAESGYDGPMYRKFEMLTVDIADAASGGDRKLGEELARRISHVPQPAGTSQSHLPTPKPPKAPAQPKAGKPDPGDFAPSPVESTLLQPNLDALAQRALGLLATAAQDPQKAVLEIARIRGELEGIHDEMDRIETYVSTAENMVHVMSE